MPSLLKIFLLFTIALTAHSTYAGMRSVSLHFYTAAIPLTFDEYICAWHQPISKNILLEQPFSQLEAHRASTLLPDLIKAKQTYLLNDWLFLQLVQQSVKATLPQHSSAEQRLLIGFLLHKAGWDVLTILSGIDIHLYFSCLEEIANVGVLEKNGRSYYSLSTPDTAIHAPLFEVELPKRLHVAPCTLDLTLQPSLPAHALTRTFSFTFRDSTYHLSLELDQTYIDWIRQYPMVNNPVFLDAPLSPTLQQSLVLALQQHIKYLSKAEKLDFLVAFTRSLPYKEDYLAFGTEKPMTPEETLYYPFSDCEDRAALLLALIKRFVPVPTIALSYPEHISIAVDLPELPGESVAYNNKRYVLCDPTGPADHSILDRNLLHHFGNQYEVILTFIP